MTERITEALKPACMNGKLAYTFCCSFDRMPEKGVMLRLIKFVSIIIVIQL